MKKPWGECTREEKEQRMEARRIWGKNNPEKIKKYHYEWNIKNTQKHRDSVREWNREHPDRVRELARLRYRKNPEIKKVAKRAWYLANSERAREVDRKWKKANKGRGRIYCNNRRARLRGNGGTYTVKEWETLKAQYDYRCPLCQKREPEIKLTVDHIIPASKGGPNVIENIQPLCGVCNSRKQTQAYKILPNRQVALAI